MSLSLPLKQLYFCGFCYGHCFVAKQVLKEENEDSSMSAAWH